jgi:hypothetical protein
MKLHRPTAALLFAALAALPARAEETVVCPSLEGIKQIGNCPTEKELDQTVEAVCSDDPVCIAAFKVVRQSKNVALWETPDGAFAGYVSCALPPGAAQAAKLEAVYMVRRELTGINCLYEKGIRFHQRTKQSCRLSDGREATDASGPLKIDCAKDAKACVVTCR